MTVPPGAIRIADAAEARAFVDENGHNHVKVGVTDIDGILRGKYMSRDKFVSSLEKGLGFCDVIVGWDSNDQLYDNVSYTGWHTAYPDAPVRIVPETGRVMPFENGLPFFLCELTDAAEAICPRGLLRRVLAKADAMGFSASAACEYEFFVFDETPESVRAKGYRDLKPITPGFFGYSVLRSSVHAELYEELLDTCRIMDMTLEGLHTETGAGVLEAAIGVDEALRAADKAILFKTFVKVLAQRRGLMATFMAKWSPDWPGQSGHIHLSLKDREGRPVFHDAAADRTISDTMRHFIGGQQKLMPEILAMVSSTVNSYSRLIPGFWAPTSAHWGIENRTTAIRAIPRQPFGAARRVPGRGRRRQPLHRHGGGFGQRPLGHRESDRAGGARARQRLCAAARCGARSAAHLVGRGPAAEGLRPGARAVRRCLRGSFRRHARMGGARVPPPHHRLGIVPLFRDHLGPARADERYAPSSPPSRRPSRRSTARSMSSARAREAEIVPHSSAGVPRSPVAARASGEARRAALGFRGRHGGRERGHRARDHLADGAADPLHARKLRGFEERARAMIALAPQALADLDVPEKPGFRRFIRRDPVGLVFVVAPWNYPFLTAVNAVVPALMAGNAVLLKHSHQTPLAAERFAQAGAAAGLPDGLLQALHLSQAMTAATIRQFGVDHVAFTGSVAGGAAIEEAGRRAFHRRGARTGRQGPRLCAGRCRS